MFIPELLVPAGNSEKLKVAVLYGADAVYLGGQRYGLRAMSENFTDAELARGTQFASRHGVKVYVTLNAFLHDEDMEGLSEYAAFLGDIGVSAVIVSDLGVATVVSSSSKLDIHLSTQASCINSHSALLWKSFGITRVILGREASIEDGAKIAKLADIEVEMFIHGAMCMAYSGNCVISNYTAGRDSNRGGCIQSCRFPYEHHQVSSFQRKSLEILSGNPQAPSKGSGYFMSSRDQEGLSLLTEFVRNGIHSLKIEGRMKSSLYAATLCRAYRQALDALQLGRLDDNCFQSVQSELRTVPHRDYCTGNMQSPAKSDSIYEHDGTSATQGTHKFLGIVVGTSEDRIALRLAHSIAEGESIEFLPPSGTLVEKCSASDMRTPAGAAIKQASQESVITLPRTPALQSISSFCVARTIQSQA